MVKITSWSDAIEFFKASKIPTVNEIVENYVRIWHALSWERILSAAKLQPWIVIGLVAAALGITLLIYLLWPQSPAVLENSIVQNIRHGESTEVAKLLKKSNYKINEFHREYRTMPPLHVAALVGQLSIVKLLVEKHEANVQTFDFYGATPLILAASKGHFEIVAYLLEKGADKQINQANSRGQTALWLAAEGGYLRVVELLLENKADFEKPDRYGWLPLDVAENNKYSTIVALLKKQWPQNEKEEEN